MTEGCFDFLEISIVELDSFRSFPGLRQEANIREKIFDKPFES